jgi:hypothetical protein
VVAPDPPLQEEAVDIGMDEAAAADLVVATEEGRRYELAGVRLATNRTTPMPQE